MTTEKKTTAPKKTTRSRSTRPTKKDIEELREIIRKQQEELQEKNALIKSFTGLSQAKLTQISTRIPETIYTEVKEMAVRRGMKMQDIITTGLCLWLEKSKQAEKDSN